MIRLRNYYVIPLIAATVTALLLSADIFGAVDVAQREKIKQDIEILEGVLDQLIIQDSPYLFSGSDQVKGIYLDGFGIMFDLESRGLLSLTDVINRSLRTIPRISFDSDENQLVINMDQDEKGRRQDVKDQDAIEMSLQKTENLIYEFYLNYASTVKSLPDNDRICINICNSEGFLVVELDDPAAPSQLRACARAGDLNDYRRGKISESKMRSLVKIDRIYDKERDRDLNILEGILDRSLGGNSKTRIIDWDGNTSGMYLDGFGALFFSSASVYNSFERMINKKAGDLERKMRQYEVKVRKAEKRLRDREEAENDKEKAVTAKKWQKDTGRVALYDDEDDTSEIFINFNFDKTLRPTDREIDSVFNCITDKIIAVLGQYGATMRNVKDDESILVAVDIANPLWGHAWNMLYIKAKKADIERYARDAITFEKFKKSVKVWKD